MSTKMPILSRSWHGPLYRLKYQPSAASQSGRQAGPRHEGALIRMAAISSVLLGEDWFGEGSEQPGLPPEHLRHGHSGRSRRRSLIGCSEALSPAWTVSDNLGSGCQAECLNSLAEAGSGERLWTTAPGWGGDVEEVPSTLMRLKLSEVINWAPG